MIVASYAAAPLEAAKWLVKIWIYKNVYFPSLREQ